MSSINTGKVLVAGLVAGLVYNILDVITGMLLLMADFSANMERLGLDPAVMESPAGMATWIVIDFLMGILIVWTYASIRPRYGPGPRTAFFAAMVPFLGVSFVMFGLSTGGMITSALYWKMTVIQFVTISIVAMVGAALYKEE